MEFVNIVCVCVCYQHCSAKYGESYEHTCIYTDCIDMFHTNIIQNNEYNTIKITIFEASKLEW
jgi:hypothetical protein